jgi:hypothetical protein
MQAAVGECPICGRPVVGSDNKDGELAWRGGTGHAGVVDHDLKVARGALIGTLDGRGRKQLSNRDGLVSSV